MFITNNNINTTPMLGLKQNKSAGDMMALAFLPSVYVNVFPCGRRRSVTDSDADTSIPFDPEARMNTEKNNRNVSGNNGAHQSYLTGLTVSKTAGGALFGTLRFTLSGYNFEISLPTSFLSSDTTTAEQNPVNFFCDQLLVAFNGLYSSDELKNMRSIYANILTQSVPLYEGQNDIMDSHSVLLRNQDKAEISTALDALKKNGTKSVYEDYFFSGLTLSTLPAAKQDLSESEDRKAYESISAAMSTNPNAFIQEYTSLRLFVKNSSGVWEINYEALLPKMTHGNIENSIDLGHVRAESLMRDGISVPSLEVLDKENGYYQLSFKKAVTV